MHQPHTGAVNNDPHGMNLVAAQHAGRQATTRQDGQMAQGGYGQGPAPQPQNNQFHQPSNAPAPQQIMHGYGNQFNNPGQGSYGQAPGQGYSGRGGYGGAPRGRFQRGGYGTQGFERRSTGWIPDEYYLILKDSCFLCGDPSHRVLACPRYNAVDMKMTPCNNCRGRQVILMHAHNACREGQQNNQQQKGPNQGNASGQGYYHRGQPPSAPARVNQPQRFDTKNSIRGGSH